MKINKKGLTIVKPFTCVPGMGELLNLILKDMIEVNDLRDMEQFYL